MIDAKIIWKDTDLAYEFKSKIMKVFVGAVMRPMGPKVAPLEVMKRKEFKQQKCGFTVGSLM